MVLSDQFFTKSGMNPGTNQIIFSPKNRENTIKILLIFGYILTVFNFLVLFFHQPLGYVIDIYSALPLSFFVSLIICYTLGTAILFFSNGFMRKLGILLLVFTYSAVLIIPYMLGYYSMDRADSMSYIGEYLQIITSGHIAGWDIYPASHIIGALLSLATGLVPHITSFIIPFIFSFVFAGGVFLCSRLFLKDQILINIAVSSSFILYLGPYNFLNVPHALFFAMMPLFIIILFRFIQDQNFSNLMLLFPCIFVVPFTHPFIVLFVISTLCAFVLFSPVLKKFVHVNYGRTIIPLIIVIIGFFLWFIYSSKLLDNFRRSFLAYQQKITEPVFYEATYKIARIDFEPLKILKMITVYYGRFIIPFIIICTALIIIYFKKDRIFQSLRSQMAFWGFFYLFFIFLELILLFNPVFSHQPDRLSNLNFMVYAQVPLFVLSVYILFLTPKPSIQKIVVLSLVLSSIWGLSLFGTFNSPNIFKPNEAVSNNEVQGMVWFFGTRVTENAAAPLSQIRRFHELVGDGGTDTVFHIPFHFGYVNDARSFAEINLYAGDQLYVVLLTIDELLYQEVPGYKEVGRYNAQDFHRFRNDYSINKIYDNLNIEIYRSNKFTYVRI